MKEPRRDILNGPVPHAGRPVIARGTPLGEGRAVVIMLHGRNATPEDILGLVPLVEQPDITYLAPAAADGSWYPQSFMAPVGENEPGISSGIAVVHRLVEDAERAGFGAERVVLLGFSQGACLACTAAQCRPAKYGGIVAYSGGLIGPPETVWPEAGSFEGTPVFFGCSDRDAHIPESRVRESAAVFERMRASVTTRIYPGMGHAVNQDEIAFTKELIAALVTD